MGAMTKTVWKVLLHEVNRAGASRAATLVEQFSVVTSAGLDDAKAQARAEIRRRNRAPRAINVSAKAPNTLIAYAMPKDTKAPQPKAPITNKTPRAAQPVQRPKGATK